MRRTCEVTVTRAGPHLLLFPLQQTGELTRWGSRARAVLGARSASQIGRREAERSGRKEVFRGQLQPEAKTQYPKYLQRKPDGVAQISWWYSTGRKVGRACSLYPRKQELGGQCWTSVLSGDSQLSTSFDKDQSAGSPRARNVPWAVRAAMTHLAVLCNLHLLPLRHLSDVEVTLWDPQQEKTTRSIRRKSKPEEMRNTFRNSCS